MRGLDTGAGSVRRYAEMEALIVVVVVLAGVAATWLYHRSTHAVLVERLAERGRQLQEADISLKTGKAQFDLLQAQNTVLQAKTAELAATLEQERRAADLRLTAAQESA